MSDLEKVIKRINDSEEFIKKQLTSITDIQSNVKKICIEIDFNYMSNVGGGIFYFDEEDIEIDTDELLKNIYSIGVIDISDVKIKDMDEMKVIFDTYKNIIRKYISHIEVPIILSMEDSMFEEEINN